MATLHVDNVLVLSYRVSQDVSELLYSRGRVKDVQLQSISIILHASIDIITESFTSEIKDSPARGP